MTLLLLMMLSLLCTGLAACWTWLMGISYATVAIWLATLCAWYSVRVLWRQNYRFTPFGAHAMRDALAVLSTLCIGVVGYFWFTR